MLPKKNLCFVPFWFKPKLERNSLSVKDLTNYNKISQHFSGEDIALLTLLNNYDVVSRFILGSKTEQTLGNSMLSYDLESQPFVSWYEQRYLEQILPLHAVLGSVLEQRLFKLETKDDNEYPNAYEINDSSEKEVFVFIYPGYFNGSRNDETKHLVNDLLKLYYAYHKYEELACMRFFKTYIEML